MDKVGLRALVLARRAAIPTAARRDAAATVCDQLARLAPLTGARAVMGYAGFGSELDLDPYLRVLLEREVGVFLPRVDGSDLLPVRVDDLDADLAPGWRGVREPRSAKNARPDRLEAVIVPGVAYDPAGRRLGYGGGHYDRFLALLAPAAVIVGVAFDEQMVDDVPAQDHDINVHILVTPTQTRMVKGAHPAADGDTG